MKMLSSEVKSLLDKLYNLRGEDSVILTKMNKEREEALSTQERTKNEKSVLLEKIDKLTIEEQTLKEEGKKLTSVLSSIDRNEFATVLDTLQIDFDPESINKKLNKMLPLTIDKVVSENKKATQELENVETEMNNAITKVEELGIREDEALENQSKLNEYFELALDGNINITRDAITTLLEKFDFSENEQREAAKILMFPEDALYEYDESIKNGDKTGKTITDVLVEAKKESEINDSLLNSSEENSKLEDIFEKAIENEAPLSEEKSALFSNESKEIKVDSNSNLDTLLNKYEINKNMFTPEQIKVLENNYNESIMNKNIESLKKYGISFEILKKKVEVLVDAELSEKLDKLINIGKEAKDISLVPEVLIKYDLNGLNNTINTFQVSGLDPKNIPLMAY